MEAEIDCVLTPFVFHSFPQYLPFEYSNPFPILFLFILIYVAHVKHVFSDYRKGQITTPFICRTKLKKNLLGLTPTKMPEIALLLSKYPNLGSYITIIL